MNEISIDYLVHELAKAECWRTGCEALFGKEFVSNEELAKAVMEVGRKELNSKSTYHFVTDDANTFEEYCEAKVLGYRKGLLTKEAFIKVFEKELRADYETYCTEKVSH